MIHLNSNLLCAIVCDTSGLKVGKHDLIQICVLPLKRDLRPDLSKAIPFDIFMQPKRPENFDPEYTKLKLSDMMLKGIDAWKANDMFEEWFEKLQLPRTKKIIPLCHDWPFIQPFLVDWLQPAIYEYMFHPEVRDIRAAAAFANDVADVQNEPIPYPKTYFQYIAAQVKVDIQGINDPITHCMIMAQTYKAMLKREIL
jgi:hypothetical protein